MSPADRAALRSDHPIPWRPELDRWGLAWRVVDALGRDVARDMSREAAELLVEAAAAPEVTP